MNRSFLAACLAFLLAPSASWAAYPFQDPDLDIEKRISDLLARMNREEKIHCLGTVPDVPRLGVQGSGHVEGLHGLAMGEVGGWGGGSPLPTTQFQQEIGLGETWDPDLMRRVGNAEGREVRYLWEKERRGGLVVRAPNADLGRDPRWGRTEECLGEDPYFNGTMASAFSRGLQGDDPRYLQSASLLKHFLANSNEKDRGKSSSDFDARLYHEYYSVPFRMAIMAGKAQGMMAAYNAVNGVPCMVHPMLKDIVIRQWKHDGILCTDGGALGMLVTEHKRYSDQAPAAADAVKAGINQFLDRHEKPVRAALYKGLLNEAQMDEALRGVFRVMIRLGQLDPPERVPYRRSIPRTPPSQSPRHRALALLAAQKSVVLLKNQDALLPLDPATIKSVAVIGPYADKVLADWYGGDAPYLVSSLEGIKKRLGPGVRVEFAPDNQGGRAVKLAKRCDVVVACVGNHPLGNGGWGVRDSDAEGKEAFDRESMRLRQEDLVKELLAANKRTVVALVCSFPVTMEWCAAKAPAILHMTHSSQEQGTALAGALFGDFNPGGRLVQTWPRSIKQLPPMMDYDIRHGRTYMYFKGKPLYPFGYGLSYSRFDYSNPRLDRAKLAQGGRVKVSVDLRNSSLVPGDEVAQLYVRHLDSKLEWPAKALKGFQRVTLAAGEKRTLDFVLTAPDLAYWDEKSSRWRLDPGKVQIMLGASSADIRQSVELGLE
ncbi:MAG: glycoside hydrolase family 3 C-terminal domain-containing protein [candidate division FCPU426 bacterium]